jgi:hypothetical protein
MSKRKRFVLIALGILLLAGGMAVAWMAHRGSQKKREVMEVLKLEDRLDRALEDEDWESIPDIVAALDRAKRQQWRALPPGRAYTYAAKAHFGMADYLAAARSQQRAIAWCRQGGARRAAGILCIDLARYLSLAYADKGDAALLAEGEEAALRAGEAVVQHSRDWGLLGHYQELKPETLRSLIRTLGPTWYRLTTGKMVTDAQWHEDFKLRVREQLEKANGHDDPLYVQTGRGIAFWLRSIRERLSKEQGSQDGD